MAFFNAHGVFTHNTSSSTSVELNAHRETNLSEVQGASVFSPVGLGGLAATQRDKVAQGDEILTEMQLMVNIS